MITSLPKSENRFEQLLNRVTWALWSRILVLEILRWSFYGCLMSIALILLSRFNVITAHQVLFYSIPPFGGVLGGVLLALFKKPSLQQSALFLDTILKLNNQLVTTLESLKAAGKSKFTELLINNSVQRLERVQLSLAYKYFTLNYFLRLVITVLVVGILLLIPVAQSPELLAKTRIAELMKEEGHKLENTAAHIKESSSLDSVAQSIVREMEQLAVMLKEKEADPIAIQERIDNLSFRTGVELERITGARQMIEEIYIALGQPTNFSRTQEILQNENDRKQLLRELENKIKKGEVTVSALSPLKMLLKKNNEKLSGAEFSDERINLTGVVSEALRALETPEISLAEPLEKFFSIMAGKQDDVLERIAGRFALLQSGLASIKLGLEIPPNQSVYATADQRKVGSEQAGSQDVFNWAGGIYPAHPAEDGRNVFFTGSLSDRIEPSGLNAPRIILAEQVIKNRETALAKPYWPQDYDEVIKKYFGGNHEK